ncbi:LysR family transcriptional regulator [Shimia isoporae]|uniref:LysR family transcriptional regulator n=1 Tax=Shimia isoporae TaxID=647720 RepID=A0A4R1N2S7_9RHOB|nr:LysR family transcriptional regulator [Shimia isoporae]TCK99761.1 LysR family transcriptional regulator [Shimia isoporae]
MNIHGREFDWNHIRAFLAVVEEGSLSGAARVLGQTQPTLSRQIGNLEEALNASLFIRGTRAARLTDTGAALFEQVQTMADAATQISRIAKGRNQTLEGTIRIAATDAMVSYVLPQCLDTLRRNHPGVDVELVPSNALADLTRHEADIAVRHVRPSQPDLIARQIGEFDVSLFASERYLTALDGDLTSETVANADFIGFEHRDRLVRQIRDLGLDVSPANFKIVAHSGVVLYELAAAGLGIALLPSVVATRHFGLTRVLPDLGEMRLPIWLVSHRDVQTNMRIRLCYDLLANALKDYLKADG